MASSSENRSYKPFFIIVLPILLLICIGGIIFAISTGHWLQAAIRGGRCCLAAEADPVGDVLGV